MTVKRRQINRHEEETPGRTIVKIACYTTVIVALDFTSIYFFHKVNKGGFKFHDCVQRTYNFFLLFSRASLVQHKVG